MKSVLPTPVKPVVAIISNSQTPYRLHLHQRIARELPEIEMWSVFTHEKSNAPWQLKSPDEIRPVFFGQGEDSERQGDIYSQWREWRKAGRILAWLKQRGVDAVVLLGYNDAGRVRIIRHCHRNRTPCILFGDSNVLGERLTGMKLAVKRRIVGSLVRRCDAIFHCGRLGAAYFQRYGARPEAMFCFPYEPDYASFEDVPVATVKEVRTCYGISTARRYLVYSGRLVDAKRVDLLLRAFADVADRRPQWDVIIVGDGPLRSTLQSSVPAPFRDRIIWTGFLDNSARVAALYKCSDILVLPSEFEPWGVVVTEAATGLALVCSSVIGAAADVLEDGINGRVFASGDVAGLTLALLDVTDPINTDRMKAASPAILAKWRSRTNPVLGLTRALKFVGVLPGACL